MRPDDIGPPVRPNPAYLNLSQDPEDVKRERRSIRLSLFPGFEGVFRAGFKGPLRKGITLIPWTNFRMGGNDPVVGGQRVHGHGDGERAKLSSDG
jgi:hypothetical protein